MALADSLLSLEARKVISRWTANGYCVYLRPLSSRLYDPQAKHRTQWVVVVEYVNAAGNDMQVREEGVTLSVVVMAANRRIPTRPPTKKRRRGWMASKQTLACYTQATYPEGGSMARIERFQSKKDGQFYWHLKDANGEVICHGEGHPAPEGAQRAVNNVAAEFANLHMGPIGNAVVREIPIVDIDPR